MNNKQQKSNLTFVYNKDMYGYQARKRYSILLLQIIIKLDYSSILYQGIVQAATTDHRP